MAKNSARWMAFVLAGILMPGSGSLFAKEPDAASPQRLSILPAELELTSSRDRRHILVSAEFADGTFADVTRESSYESLSPAVAAIAATGIVEPTGNGETEILARYGELEARCRVTVSQFNEPPPIEFRTEVIAAFSRGGCNQGACHGSPQGKNGFRLSLRGFDPDVDFRYLTRDIFSRRVNPSDAADSLLLRKASGVVAHQGGIRFHGDEPAFEVLRDWIAQGCRGSVNPRTLERLEVLPGQRRLHTASPHQQLVVLAHYADGAAADVTDLVAFSSADESAARVTTEGLVEFQKSAEAAILARFLDKIASVRLMYVRHDPQFTFTAPPPANDLDRFVFARHEKLQLVPADVADDAVFLRRVYLDTIGGIPTPEEASLFLDSAEPNKRAKLIDALLQRPEYAYFWGMKWADVMRGNRETITERGVHNFHRYLVRSFAYDRPFDKVAREIIVSRGNPLDEPGANFYRISRTPDEAAESFSQLFLGVRIQCAKCHNHPYESITQTDYYGLAAYFARVRIKGTRYGLDDEIIYLDQSGEVKFPATNADVAPTAFGVPAGTLTSDDDRRERLADWLTNPENPYFAASTVNRVWSHLTGQGIVEPVDDFRDSNPPSNPDLLQALSHEFVAGGFRLKPVIRSILNSHTYQLRSEFRRPQSEFAADPDRYFARSQVRMLSAEQILDAISTATGIPEPFSGYPVGTKAIELAEGAVDHHFLKAFTRPIRDVACDCARETEPTLSEVVHLLNNPVLLEKLASPENRLAGWIGEAKPDGEIVELLYLSTLSRRPTPEETQIAVGYLKGASERGAAFEDLQHALINSNEFLFRH